MLPDKQPVLFERDPKNPILMVADWSYPINSVFNPAAIRLRDGTTCCPTRTAIQRNFEELKIFGLPMSRSWVSMWSYARPARAADQGVH